MRVPVSWLKEFVDIDLSIEALAELLTTAGLEVEHVHYIGIEGGHDKERLRWDPEKLVISQILKVEQHPNADKLVLATVEYGADEPEVVVTGAPNLQPYKGQGDLTDKQLYSPLALEGATLYDGHKEGYVKTKLKSKALRGIENRSMLCSEKELGISDEHEGIMILNQGTPGTPLTEVFGDAIFEIDIIPNIARCASILGVAREIAALTNVPLKVPQPAFPRKGESIEGRVTVRTEDEALNPRFTLTKIEGVTLGPSPEWMQRRLRLVGMRPINVVVDISNYVMMEIGQPNHTFDYDFLRKRADEYNPKGPIELITRMPQEGETLTTLDGAEHQLKPFNILVTDPKGVLSLGGIMGGAESEIQDDTTNVLLESASWDFMNIRRSANALKINTDAGFRFSRGVHPSQASLGALRVCQLLHELAGGTVSADTVDMYPTPYEAKALPLTTNDVKRIGGVELSLEEIKTLLERQHFDVSLDGDKLMVKSPDTRLDIHMTNDIVEEVCRIYGYDNIPNGNMADPLPPQRNNIPLGQEMFVKDLLVDLGFQEIITYRLTNPERENKLTPGMSLPEDPNEGYVALANSISVDKTVMRKSVLACALDIVAENSKFIQDLSVFEWGKIYLPDEAHPVEKLQLALVMTGKRQQQHWIDPNAPTSYDFFDLKGVLDALLEACHISQWDVVPTEHPTFTPGRTAELLVEGKRVAVFGKVHPLVVEAFDIRINTHLLAAEIDVEVLQAYLQPAFTVEPISTFPAVQEDIALVVEQSMPASQVEAEIRKAGGFLLRDVELFDVYEGEQLEEGKRSLAYHLTFQSPQKTLTDKEVGKQRKKIISQLEKSLGVSLR